MKKFITIAALLLLAFTCHASEICRNPKTGASLDEVAGIYSIRTSTGILPLGDRKDTRDFLATAEMCFMNKNLESFSIGKTRYTVHEDEDGMYIIKVGLGVVKVRPSDPVFFLGKMGWDTGKEKARKIWDVIKE